MRGRTIRCRRLTRRDPTIRRIRLVRGSALFPHRRIHRRSVGHLGVSSIAHGQSLVVTETAPADGDVKVSPELGEIVVRSSASVDTSSYAFVISPDGEFPEVTADRYDDPNADVNLQLTKDFKLSQVRPRGPAR